MDRDECSAAAPTGDSAPAACLNQPPTDEFELNALLEPASPPAQAPSDTPRRLSLPAAGARPAGDVSPAQIIEALLFSSDRPLSATRLAELSGVGSIREVRLHIADLNAKYLAAGLTFRIQAIARGYQMLTQARYQPWLARLHQEQARTRLSPAALETLAVVAYKQPVIRADIEAVRGVACGEVLNRLREMGLVKVVGRAEVVGRPLLYGTTRKFLEVFGLADLDELPPLETLSLRGPASWDAEGPTSVSPELDLGPAPVARSSQAAVGP